MHGADAASARAYELTVRGGEAVPPAISGSSALVSRLQDPVLVPPAPSTRRVDDSLLGADDSNRAVFWAWDFHRSAYYAIRADRVYQGSAAWIYVEQGAELSPGTTKALGAVFEEAVYPRIRQSFGPEPVPGIDGQQAVTVLLLDIRDALYYEAAPHTYYSGYYDPVNQRRQADLDPELPNYRSNEREMIYLDIAPTDPDGAVIRQSMAHEFAHLVHWSYDQHEEEWLAEGLSELAVRLCDLGHPREHVDGFLAAPDLSLTSWVGDIRDYGKVYLFMLYLHEQVGQRDPSWLRRLVAHPGHGLQSLNDVLPLQRSLPELLRDFAVAVYVDSPTAAGPRFGFASLELVDAPSGQAFRRPAPRKYNLDTIEHLQVEMAPWSWKGLAFEPAREALDLEAVPENNLCIGWASGERSAAAGTMCLAPGEPFAWPLPNAEAGVGPFYVFLANGTPLGNSVAVATAPFMSTQTVRSHLYVPLAAHH
jgi:hypothetical protein